MEPTRWRCRGTRFEEAEQFDFDVVVGELERAQLSALTVTGLRKDRFVG
jgi:hypothetical protein